MAKEVTPASVRVVGCTLLIEASRILRGVDRITGEQAGCPNGRPCTLPAVADMSVEERGSSTVGTALRTMITAGRAPR